MDEAVWAKYFKGYSIVDVAILSKHKIYFCLKQDPPKNSPTVEDDDLVTRIVVHRPAERDAKRWALVELNGIKHPKVGVSLLPEPQLLMVDFHGSVYSADPKRAGFEKDMDIPAGVSITKVACIDRHAYALGTSRSVFLRRGLDRWTAMHPKSSKRTSAQEDESEWGFNALAGFDQGDLYAGGGTGDLWHFNGKSWRQLPLPTNAEINDLCCGDDGLVYIAANGGLLFVGRDEKWQLLEQDVEPSDLDEVVWYRDRAYIASWMGLFEAQRSRFAPVQVGTDPPQHSFGHVATGDGILISAGPKEAFVFDGKQWQPLVADLEEDEA
jgi:hypothetical protein